MSAAGGRVMVCCMDEKLSLPQRIAGAGAALLTLVFLAVVAASPARAACPIDQPDCGRQPSDFTSTLTITPPASGQVIVTAAGGIQTVCSTSQPAPCTISDTRTVLNDIRPTTGWPTYTLHWSGSHATWDGWSGACTGFSDCTVTNDQDTKSVTATTHVTPTTVTVNVPNPVYADSTFSAFASGDLGPFTFSWVDCGSNGIFSNCISRQMTSGANYSSFFLNGLADGTYHYALVIKDALGNETVPRTMVFTVQGLGLQVSDLPALTTSPAFNYSSTDASVAQFLCSASAMGSPAQLVQPCQSGTNYAPKLSDGTWQLSVTARDASGIQQTVSRTTTVDTTPPAITFDDGPAEGATIGTSSTQVAFTSAELHPGTTSCTVDGAAASSCTSPIALTGLANGAHKVVVTSTDAVGNTAAAERDFSVALPSTLTAGKLATTYGRPATLVAQVTPSTAAGTVTFDSAGRTLCSAKVASGVAHCAAPLSLTAGSHSVTAHYAGAYAPSVTTFALTVAKAVTHVAATIGRGTVHKSQRETITAKNVHAGIVTVSKAGHVLCRAKATGGTTRCSFTATMAPGRYALAVRYGGNADYLASQTTVHIRVIR
jgi:hypothetical protein